MANRTTPTAPRHSRLKRVLLMALVPVLIVIGVAVAQADRVICAAETYMFGYPLVIMDVTRLHFAQTIGAENHLQRVREFPDSNAKYVVKPNIDTLYTTGFIDMNQGPWVFEMAANDQRYEVMEFMDAWTNVFAAPGTRSTGTGGGRFLLVGPKWQGAALPGMTVIRSSTRIVWLIGRTQTNGAADYPLVHRLQDGLDLHTFAAPQSAKDDAVAAWHPVAAKRLPPVMQMQEMSSEAFFARLAMLMTDNPPAAADTPMLDKLARLGISPGHPAHWGMLDRWSVALGRHIADWKVARALKASRDRVRGWVTPPANVGNFGTDYNTRAVAAMVGLGVNLPADAIYPSTDTDSEGKPLNGHYRYRLHFDAGKLPPVNAFWSVTAYGTDNFLIDNPIHRYALGDRDPLVFNADGSLDLFVQSEPPDNDKKSNWLPVKADQAFQLNARLYWPKPEALNGTWGVPGVERID